MREPRSVAVVTGGMPSTGHSGDSVVIRTVVERLRARAVSTSVVVLLSRDDLVESREWIDGAQAELEALGAGVTRIAVADGPLPIDDPDAALFPYGALAEPLGRELAGLAPDAVLGFDTGTLLALERAGARPVLAILGDPQHLVRRYQLLEQPLRKRFTLTWARQLRAYLRDARRAEAVFVRLARTFDRVGVFGAQHAAWLRTRGVDAQYFRLPVRDRLVGLPEGAAHDGPLRILHLGGLNTTATRHGLVLLANDILPGLERALPQGSFAVRLVGAGTLAPALASRLARPEVEVVGFVDDTAAEIADADIFLAPSPYPVGARTRIVDAMSIGACIVAHEAAAAGIPELVTEENSLLAGDGHELTTQILRAAGDEQLRRRLGAEARQTYEAWFAPDVACDVLIDELLQLGARSGGA